MNQKQETRRANELRHYKPMSERVEPLRESNKTLQEIQSRVGTLNFAKGIACDAQKLRVDDKV